MTTSYGYQLVTATDCSNLYNVTEIAQTQASLNAGALTAIQYQQLQELGEK